MDVLFYMINGVILLFIFAGGVYIKKIRPIFMKKAVVAILAVLFFANGAAAFVFNDGVQSFVSLSPDLGALTVVKKDKNGRTTVYEKSEVPFVKPVDTLPFTMSGKPKLQWLADDVCAVTYKSPDDGGTHQYVGHLRRQGRCSQLLLCLECGTRKLEGTGKIYRLFNRIS